MSKKSKQKNNHSHSNNKPEGNSDHGKKLDKKVLRGGISKAAAGISEDADLD